VVPAIGTALDRLATGGDEILGFVGDDLRRRASGMDDAAWLPPQLASDAVAFLAIERGAAEQLCAIELALALLEAAQRRREVEPALP
jgi:hypothetical protein